MSALLDEITDPEKRIEMLMFLLEESGDFSKWEAMLMMSLQGSEAADLDDLMASLEISDNPPKQAITDEIRRDYEEDAHGHWTLKTKRWSVFHANAYEQAGLEAPALKVENPEGDGNCFHRAVASALGIKGDKGYQDVKRRTANFVREHAKRLFTFDFLYKNLVLIDFSGDFDGAVRSALQDLEKDGAFANEVTVQLTALAHNVEINVESLVHPGQFQKYPALTSSERVINLLIRDHKATGVYRLEKGGFVLEGGADGHFWLRVD
jgi:hypothetical protein